MDKNDFYNKQSNNIKLNELNDLKEAQKKIEELNKIIIEKNNEIKKLKSEYNNYDNMFNEILPGEKIISVALLTSTDKKFLYSLPCKTSTLFVKIEEKLYEKFPEYKQTDNYFLIDGKKVKRFISIEENGIENGKPIILVKE